jgi:hypothetical protein
MTTRCNLHGCMTSKVPSAPKGTASIKYSDRALKEPMYWPPLRGVILSKQDKICVSSPKESSARRRNMQIGVGLLMESHRLCTGALRPHVLV